jgi:spermidine/putrescine transport system substrate-binding protein
VEKYYDSDEQRDKSIALTNGYSFDVIMISSDKVNGYAARRWLDPIGVTVVSNLKHIDVEKAKKVASTIKKGLYGVPCAWGPMGVVYRKDLVAEVPQGWNDLYNAPSSLNGKIMVLNDGQV